VKGFKGVRPLHKPVSTSLVKNKKGKKKQIQIEEEKKIDVLATDQREIYRFLKSL